ncbi:MAG TPA: MarR family transcriptional regulator [Ktedonobacterales bacterium]|jgi:DNA-binding MarR family transcriptional regulator
MSEVKDSTGIEQDVYRLLTKLFLLLDDCDRQFFTEYGLSARQFWALQHLDEQQGRSMVELSRALLTDKSNVTGIVDRLEQASLAQRTPDPHDRRVIQITLTAEGRRLRDFVNQRHEARIRELFSTVGDGRLYALQDTLTLIGRNLEAYLEEPPASRADSS